MPGPGTTIAPTHHAPSFTSTLPANVPITAPVTAQNASFSSQLAARTPLRETDYYRTPLLFRSSVSHLATPLTTLHHHAHFKSPTAIPEDPASSLISAFPRAPL